MHSRLQVLTRVIKLCNEIEEIFTTQGVAGNETVAPYNALSAGFNSLPRGNFLLGWSFSVRDMHLSVDMILSWREGPNHLFTVHCDQSLLPNGDGPVWKTRYCFATSDSQLRKLADTWDIAPNKDRVTSKDQAIAIIRALVDFYVNHHAAESAIAVEG